MNTNDFTTTFTTNHTAEAVYKAINNVRGWWSEAIAGPTDEANGVFDYHYLDVHKCRIKLTELVPNQKVAWHVLENYFKFTSDKSEWTGTDMLFEISEHDGKTQLTFTHKGLVPQYECYEICETAWTQYIQESLKGLIETGKGKPNDKDKPQTEAEKQFLAENK